LSTFVQENISSCLDFDEEICSAWIDAVKFAALPMMGGICQKCGRALGPTAEAGTAGKFFLSRVCQTKKKLNIFGKFSI
jgi:hypothetical protein